MNKNIKRIVAMALSIGTVSAVSPATNVNLLTTKAYASSDDADTLDSLKLLDEDGDTLDLYEDDEYEDDSDTEDIDSDDEGETYYVETSSDEVSIEIEGADEDHVRIFKGSSETDYKVGDDISISSDTTLNIRIYENDYDDYDDYDDAEDSDYNEYKIKVEYNDEDDSDDEDNDYNDEDTLASLELLDEDDDNITLYEDDDYDEDVDSDEVDPYETYYAKTSSDEVSIETDGPDDAYVKIFKSTSDSTKGINPGDSISMTGDKILTVRIYEEEPDSDITYEEDEDVIGEYTIELEDTNDDSISTSTEATTTESTTTIPSSTTSAVTETIKVSQWVQVNEKWQYNDAVGNSIKNSWFYDRDLSKSYYLQADGNMATGWLSNNAKWYYLGTDGAMKTGWQLVNGTWYYLDSQGVMASNTTINGYKLSSTGSWIK